MFSFFEGGKKRRGRRGKEEEGRGGEEEGERRGVRVFFCG